MKRHDITICAALFLLGMALLSCDEQEGAADDPTNDSTTAAAPGGATPPDSPAPGGPPSDAPVDPATLNLPFYGNATQIVSYMGTIPGAQAQAGTQDSYGTTREWVGGRFEDIPVDQWGFGFNDEQMTYGRIHFSSPTTGMAGEQLYQTLTEKLTARFGAPLFDAKNMSSRALVKYTEAEQAFISKVGTSIGMGDFRMWTPNDSTGDFLITLNMGYRDKPGGISDVYLTIYDRIQSERYFKKIESTPAPTPSTVK